MITQKFKVCNSRGTKVKSFADYDCALSYLRKNQKRNWFIQHPKKSNTVIAIADTRTNDLVEAWPFGESFFAEQECKYLNGLVNGEVRPYITRTLH